MLIGGQTFGQYYYRSNCSPTYCPPTYSTPTYSTPTYTPTWAWKQWERDPRYWIRYKVTNNIIENDGWLYVQQGSFYEKSKLISDYADTFATYTPETYRVIQQYPYLNKPGLIIPSAVPGFIDPRDFLPPLSDTSLIETASKAQISTTEMALKIAQGEQAKELEKIKSRNELAKAALIAQNDATFMGELQKLFALRQKSAILDVDSDKVALQIATRDPALAKLVAIACISCHGPTKQDAGIDFRSLEPDSEVWLNAWAEVKAGTMPKNGTRLTPEQVQLFRDQTR